MKRLIQPGFVQAATVISVMILGMMMACSSGPSSGNTTVNTKPINVNVWTTLSDKSALLQTSSTVFGLTPGVSNVVEIDTTTTYQTMDGFGFALTGGSAQLIMQKLSSGARTSLLNELFLSDNGIGISYLRISMGSSDLDAAVFSYDDMPAGKTDSTLANFDLSTDKLYLIPLLKEIISLRPDIHIMASPWSPPAWMKSNQNSSGGSLKTNYYGSYANYFVKYVQAMAAQGITIEAVTLQNEPENANNNPAMLMTAAEEAQFVKANLGPAFQKASISTKIIVFDHNCDHPNYPISVLQDATANPFIDGSAFHLYLGDISALSQVHEAFPNKNLYFTEQWTSGNGDFGGDLRWHLHNLIIGAPRNWSKNVIEWNLAADETFSPHTPGGCSLCQGALTINSTSGAVTRNVSYYIIAHASKFVPPGSVRIKSNYANSIYNVAYITPQGKKVLIAVNDSSSASDFTVNFHGKYMNANLPAGGVATYVW